MHTQNVKSFSIEIRFPTEDFFFTVFIEISVRNRVSIDRFEMEIQHDSMDVVFC